MNLLHYATSGFARKLVLGLVAPACLLAPLAAAAPANASAGDTCYANNTNWTCNTKAQAPIWDAFSHNIIGYTTGGLEPYNCKNDHGVTYNNAGGPHPARWEYIAQPGLPGGWVADGNIYSDTDPLPNCPGT